MSRGGKRRVRKKLGGEGDSNAGGAGITLIFVEKGTIYDARRGTMLMEKKGRQSQMGGS